MTQTAPVSMTGFASVRGQGEGLHASTSWSWELRSVNGKGLDLRLRLPEGIEGLEMQVRAALTQLVVRGNVTVGLRLARSSSAEGMRVSASGLTAALAALTEVHRLAEDQGLGIVPASAADVLGLRGVIETGPTEEADPAALLKALMGDFHKALAAFDEMRRAEGRALLGVLSGQLDQIERLIAAARDAAEARRPKAAEALRDAMAKVVDVVEADPQRIAQELALLAVKADITEETDRLTAHIAAARALLSQGGAIGRKFDFLTQEFNREANTLCSKSGDIALTRIGLDLKHLIDQMREQVQNLE